MSFKNVFASIMETEAEEVARLATAPAGSINHGISSLPVAIQGNLEGRIIRLPEVPFANGGSVVVVVPTERTDHPTNRTADGRRHLHDGWWKCVVVYSNNRSYPVGGYQLSIPTAELVRGTQISLEGVVR
ncbi:MAG TPA: hypothetical protein VFU07_04970 [Candidatus Lumbricidophila sp.]|nr:hypothetical protein [Candidatus Lumbricidophila sp.]